jgi:hypothetical protein
MKTVVSAVIVSGHWPRAEEGMNDEPRKNPKTCIQGLKGRLGRLNNRSEYSGTGIGLSIVKK